MSSNINRMLTYQAGRVFPVQLSSTIPFALQSESQCENDPKEISYEFVGDERLKYFFHVVIKQGEQQLWPPTTIDTLDNTTDTDNLLSVHVSNTVSNDNLQTGHYMTVLNGANIEFEVILVFRPEAKIILENGQVVDFSNTDQIEDIDVNDLTTAIENVIPLDAFPLTGYLNVNTFSYCNRSQRRLYTRNIEIEIKSPQAQFQALQFTQEVRTTPVANHGGTDGTLDVKASGLEPIYYQLYQLQDGEFELIDGNNIGMFTNLPVGQYYVKVIDGTQREINTDIVTITQPEPRALVLDRVEVINVSGWNRNDGGLRVFLSSAGEGNLAYTVFDESGILVQTSTTNPITGLAPGTYRINVTDSLGSVITTEPITIPGINPQVLSLGQLMLVQGASFDCNPDILTSRADAIIEVMVESGEAPFEFQLVVSGVVNPLVQTTGRFEGLMPGTYQVLVTDNTGSQLSSNSITIVTPEVPVISVSELTYQMATQFGLEDAVIDFTAPETHTGCGTLMYTLKRIQQGNIFTVRTAQMETRFEGLAAGTYVVEVSNELGQLFTTEPITIPTTPAVMLELGSLEIVNETMFGAGDGMVTVPVIQSQGAPSFVLIRPNGLESPSQDVNVFTNLAPGEGYMVRVSDMANVVTSPGFNIEAAMPMPLMVNFEVVNETSVDANDGIVRIITTEGQAPIDISLLRIADQARMIANNMGNYNNLTPGEYRLLASDAANQSQSYNINIEAYTPVALQITGLETQPTQIGQATGSVNVMAVGETPLTFTLTLPNGQTEIKMMGVFTGLAAGQYRIRVDDSMSTSVEQTFTISTEDVDPLLVEPFIIRHQSDWGSIDSGITVNRIVNAIGDINVRVTKIDSGTVVEELVNPEIGVFIPLPSGNYEVVVSDGFREQESTINIRAAQARELTGRVIDQENTAPNMDNGLIRVVAQGEDPITMNLYSVPVGELDLNNQPVVIASNDNGLFENVAAGRYFIQLMDVANQSLILGPVVIEQGQYAPLTIEIVNITMPSSYGGGDGSFNINITSQAGDVDLTVVDQLGNIIVEQLTSPLTNFTVSDLMAGEYTVNVQDIVSNQMVSEVVTLSQPDPSVLEINNISIINESLVRNDGQIWVEVINNIGITTYELLQNGVTVETQIDDFQFLNLAPGEYTARVTDSLNRSVTSAEPIFVLEYLPISIRFELDVADETSYDAGDGQLTITIPVHEEEVILNITNADNISIAERFLNPGDTPVTFTDLAPGEYSVAVRVNDDINTVLGVIAAFPPQPLIPNEAVITHPMVFGQMDGAIVATNSTGQGEKSYELINSDTNEVVAVNATGEFMSLAPGNYELNVSDEADQFYSLNLILNEYPLDDFVMHCVNENEINIGDGSITATVSGGAGLVQFSLYRIIVGVRELLSSNNLGSFTDLTAGNYVVVATDEANRTVECVNEILLVNPCIGDNIPFEIEYLNNGRFMIDENLPYILNLNQPAVFYIEFNYTDVGDCCGDELQLTASGWDGFPLDSRLRLETTAFLPNNGVKRVRFRFTPNNNNLQPEIKIALTISGFCGVRNINFNLDQLANLPRLLVVSGGYEMTSPLVDYVASDDPISMNYYLGENPGYVVVTFQSDVLPDDVSLILNNQIVTSTGGRVSGCGALAVYYPGRVANGGSATLTIRRGIGVYGAGLFYGLYYPGTYTGWESPMELYFQANPDNAPGLEEMVCGVTDDIGDVSGPRYYDNMWAGDNTYDENRNYEPAELKPGTMMDAPANSQPIENILSLSPSVGLRVDFRNNITYCFNDETRYELSASQDGQFSGAGIVNGQFFQPSLAGGDDHIITFTSNNGDVISGVIRVSNFCN